jgi:uncharacterized protein (TIGR02466 family)
MGILKLQALQPLFHTPLATFELQDGTALNRQLLAEVSAMRAVSDGVSRSNRHGWHSDDDFFERTEPGCTALRSHVLEAVRQCTLELSPGFDCARNAVQAEGWFNVLGRGGYNTPHDHPAWVWSGCYYVQVPRSGVERSGSIEFLDSRTNVRTLTVEGAGCFASKFLVQPRAGMLILFPSYLRHWVYPNESDEERISVAFNVRFVKTSGG